MNRIFTLIFLIIICISSAAQAQGNGHAVPLNEVDSMFVGPLPGHMAFQYNRTKSYNSLCLDTFELFTDAAGLPVMRETYTYGMGYSGWHMETVVAERYTAGAWTNYGKTYEPLFPGSCVYAATIGVSWTGASWSDTTTAHRTTCSFDAHGQPLHSYEIQYDNGSGLWFPFDERYNRYDASNRLIGSDHTIWCTGTGSCMFNYKDTFYSYDSYNNYCDSKPDSFVTLKLTNGQWLQNGKSKYAYYPNGTQLLYFTDNTGNGVLDSSSIMLQLHDRFGNDSIYLLRNYNRGTHQWGTESYNVYINTYDADNNLIRVLNMSDYQTTNKDSLQPYTITRYSNYVACSASPAGISTLEQGAINIYPNPSNGKFTISLPDYGDDMTLTLTDLMGQKIKEQKITSAKTEINLDQPDGIYLVNLSSDHFHKVQKLILQR